MRPSRPRRGSPFREIRSIYQIWPWGREADATFIREFYGVEVSSEPALWDDFVRKPGHPAQRFLACASNDARIKSVKVEDDHVEIVINDYHAWRLGTMLARSVAPRSKLFFPLTMRFEGLNEFVAYASNLAGNLRLLQNSRRDVLSRIDEFQRDWVVRWGRDRIVVLLDVLEARSRSVVLGIDATSLSLQEDQRSAWSDCFGEDWLWLYDRFDTERSHFYAEGIDAFGEFIKSEIASRA